MSSSQPRPISPTGVSFGPFEYDRASGELRKHGIKVRCQGQPVQILEALLARPGQVVTREELQQQIWPNTAFGDLEQGLNAAVNRLRQVLGDSADQPLYIETLPGKGYRFIAPVQRRSPPPVPFPVAAPAPRQKRWLIPAIAVACLAVLVPAGWFLFRRQAPASLTPLRLSVTPPPGFALQAASSRQSLALSPDGSKLAFTALGEDGSFNLFLRDFSESEARAVPGTQGVYTFFWAPDGKSIFLSVRGRLRRQGLNETSFQEICDSPAMFKTGAYDGTGSLLLDGRPATLRVPLSGGTPQPAKELYSWPQLLPDGKHILYVVWDPAIGRYRARVSTYGDASATKELVETDSRAQYTASSTGNGGYLMYVRAGNLLAHPFDPKSLEFTGQPVPIVPQIYSFHPTGAADFSVSDSGVLAYSNYLSRSQIAWVDRAGRTVGTIGPSNVNGKYARISPDGRKAAISFLDVERGGNSIWVYDTASGRGMQVVNGPGHADNAVWSPDSRSVAFMRSNGGPPGLALKGISPTDKEETLPSTGFQIPLDWSSDGRFVLFATSGFPTRALESQGDIYIVDMQRGRKTIPLLNTRFHEGQAAFSPDGKWLAFTSDETGRTEVYLQRFEGGDAPRLTGDRHPVSKQGVLALRWRADGKELFYVGGDGSLYAVPVALGRELKTGEPARLFKLNLHAMAALHSLFGFDVSADGRRFLIPTVATPETGSIIVVRNWEGLLTRR